MLPASYSVAEKNIIFRIMPVINKNLMQLISIKKKKTVLLTAVLFCPVLICSCASLDSSPDKNVHEQVKAENRIMKQTVTLAVRENSILKEENIQYKSESGKLKAKVKLLESEIESLNKKHDQDIALLNEKYDNIHKKNIILEQESSSKIKELTEINKAIEDRMTKEVTKLNDNIRKQEEKFNNDRAAMETLFSSKEQEYQKQLVQLKKEILTANMEMESLKSKLAESEANYKTAKAELLKQEEVNRELKLKIDSLSAENEKTIKDSPENTTGNQ